MKSYDVIVIGAGSGGLVAATLSNRLGKKTALLEKNKVGGECLHTGCIPSKTLISTAKLLKSLDFTRGRGLPQFIPKKEMDFGMVMDHVDKTVQEIYKNENPEVFQEMGIDVFVHPSGARFINEKQLKIGSETFGFKHAIICTGSSPRLMNLPGAELIEFLHNENFWDIRKLPISVLFLGGGVISAELGQALSRFGSQVTIADRNSRILKILDEDTGEIIRNAFLAEYITLLTESTPKGFRKENGHIVTRFESKGKILEVETEAVFLATGRKPNIHNLDFEKAGVQASENGILVNEYLQTNNPRVYCCGDVVGPMRFTHMASYQAEICVENIIKGKSKKNDLTGIPWAIFTDPEIAHVGLNETMAKNQFNGVQIFKVEATLDRFVTESKTNGFFKLVIDANDKILGAESVGVHSGEWIQLITLGMKNNISLQGYADTVFIYPTFSEIVKKAFVRFLRNKKSANSFS